MSRQVMCFVFAVFSLFLFFFTLAYKHKFILVSRYIIYYRRKPVATDCNWFSSVFSFEATGNRSAAKTGQPQPTVQLQLVRLSLVSVIFSVHATGPSNTMYITRCGHTCATPGVLRVACACYKQHACAMTITRL